MQCARHIALHKILKAIRVVNDTILKAICLTKRGARAGTGRGRARVSPTMTTPCRAGRTCRRGSARADPLRRASAAGSEDPEAAAAAGRRRDAPLPVLSALQHQRWQ